MPSIDIENRHGLFPCRCMMPLTATTHVGSWSDTHRTDADLARQNDRVRSWRQMQIGTDRRENNSESRVVRRGNMLSWNFPDWFWCPRNRHAAVAVCEVGQFPQPKGSRYNKPCVGERLGSRNAKNQSKRGRDLLRSPWQRPDAAIDPRLFVDVFDVAGPNRGAVATSQTRVVGHARPRSV